MSGGRPKVLVVGGGGREHALAHVLSRSPSRPEVLVAPGNPGTATCGRNIPLAVSDLDGIVKLATDEAMDLVVVGPEAPLVAGLADRLRSCGIAVLGPSAEAARLEGSKRFAKEIMTAADVPTAAWIDADEDPGAAEAFLARYDGRVAVKADGLAGGKGVVVTSTLAEARSAMADLMARRVGGGQIILEERLEGPELSVIAITDGNGIVLMAPAQDHKRLEDGDGGPNTGGMGAYAPAPIGTHDVLEMAETRCIRPILGEMKRRGTPFQGVLYAGLMMTKDGPKVLEYNVRFGDPETQVILPMLDEDLFELLRAAATGNLESRPARLRDGAAATVVLAAPGYPTKPQTGSEIRGLESASRSEDVVIFHAGTREDDRGAVLTDGGRVLAVTGLGEDLQAAVRAAYAGAEQIEWEGCQYRRDIAYQAL